MKIITQLLRAGIITILVMFVFSSEGKPAADNVQVILSAYPTALHIQDTLEMQIDLVVFDREMPINAFQNGYPEFLPTLQDFTVLSEPTWIGGTGTMQKTRYDNISLNYKLAPDTIGNLTIGPVHMTFDNQQYVSNSVHINVVDSLESLDKNSDEEDTQNTPDIFIETSPDTNVVFAGQQVNVNYNILSRFPVREFQVIEPDSTTSEDYHWYDLSGNPPIDVVDINGQRYYKATVRKLAYFFYDTDRVHIPVLEFEVERQSSRRTSLYNSFYSDPFGYTIREHIQSDSIPILVKPLPEEDKPEEYTNAVGTYSLTSAVDTSTVVVNTPVELLVTVEGIGDIRKIQLPDIPSSSFLQMFNPEITQTIQQVNNVITGKAQFKYVCIPRDTGIVSLPLIPFSFFDPNAETYQTVQTGGQSIQVIPDPNLPMISSQSGITRTENRGQSSHLRKWVLVSITLIVLGWSVRRYYSMIKTSRDGLRENREFLSRINTMIDQAQEATEPKDTCEILENALLIFFREYLEIDTNQTQEEIVAELINKGVDRSLCFEVSELLSNCEQIRFSGNVDINSSLEDLMKDGRNLIARLKAEVRRTTGKIL